MHVTTLPSVGQTIQLQLRFCFCFLTSECSGRMLFGAERFSWVLIISLWYQWVLMGSVESLAVLRRSEGH